MAEKITQKLIAELEPPRAGNRIVFDDNVRGFGVRITASGAKSYVLNYRIAGRERRYTIARSEDMTATAARELARSLRGDIAKGIDPMEEKERQRHEFELEHGLPTFNDLVQEYFAHAEARRRPHTLYDYRAMAETILQPQLGQRKVLEIGREDLSRIHASLKATPYKANRCLALASAMFSYAIEEKHWRPDNPAKGIERFHEDRREYWLEGREFERLLEALKELPKRQADALRLIMLTGARKSEVLSAAWAQFDLKHGIWTKPSHHTKQKKTEHVPLSAAALELLHRIERDKSGYLFPGKFPGTHLEDVKGAWALVRTKVGIKQCRIHDLRHTFASHLASKGESLQTIGRLLGHTQPQTTARYAHLADSALRDAANRFGAIYTAKEQD